MTLLKYSFSLTPPVAATPAQPEVMQAYTDSEFLLDLLPRWRQHPTAEADTLTFQSGADGAALIISADFFDIPDDQAQAIAEECLARRIAALEAASPGAVRVLQQNIKPHASGAGLELSFAAEVEGEHVQLYLGYVTARKILNFAMVCQPGRPQALALFNATVPGFRPRLP